MVEPFCDNICDLWISVLSVSGPTCLSIFDDNGVY